jgi:DNA-binding LacI/PurR family transcriptional regulator
VASLQDVQLTTVAQPKREMGRIAAELLFDAMADEGAGVTTAGTDTPGPNRVVLEPELIVRRSSRAVGAVDNATRA